MNSAGLTLARMPDGFWPPLKCHSGIIANSTRHQMNAMTTQRFSCLPAGTHHVPAGDTIAECASLCGRVTAVMAASPWAGS